VFALGALVGVATGFAAAWGMAFLGYRVAQLHAAEEEDDD
jgi:hypothetical protein